MRRQILISLILLGSVPIVNAQWNGTNPIWTTSKVGIGINSPNGLLDIQETTSNNGGQSIVNIIGSKTAGDGARLVLNQVWNGNYYKTILDNHGGANAQTGSGLKIQTSYWNGSQVYTKTSLTLTPTGSLGLGISSPTGMLDIQKTTSNDGGQSIVNIIGSKNTGDGARLVLNQVWNGNYYKTIIDNNGDVYRQTGSGLKIQTSYWNGSQVTSLTSLSISPNGNIGIGVDPTSYKLDVMGTIRANEVKVNLEHGADFVFEQNYTLRTIPELEKFIKENKHLPDIAPAYKMVKEGTNLGELNTKLLQKIEELTLYTISQQKEIDVLKEQNSEIERLKEIIERNGLK